MKSVAIIGFTGKGLFNTPLKIDNVKDLHTGFGKKSNLVSVAEQLIYEDHKPIVVRLEDNSITAAAYLLDEDDTICMTIEAESPGSIGNLTAIEITRNADSFSILVFNSGEMVEFWGNLKPEEAEGVVNLASKWINISMLAKALPAVGTTKLCAEKQKQPEVSVEAILKAIKNIDVEFISISDCESSETINLVLQYLEEEKPNTILIIDPPWESDLLQTYKWCKSLLPTDNGIIFWPWLSYEQKSVPPSGSVLAAILNWPLPWMPVRAKLAGISDVMFNTHHDELVFLSKQEHFINLLSKKNDCLFVDRNLMTLAGNRVSERRLINHIKAKISQLGIELLSVHSPISNNFRNNFIGSSEYILDQIKEDQGINNYSVRVNELSNPEIFDVNIEVAIKDSTEIVNICFKFTK